MGENAVPGVAHARCEFADDLFENIFQGDNAHHFAVFVHHNRQAQLVLLEVQQLRVQGRTFGDEVGVVHFPFQGTPVQTVLVDHPAEVAQVQHADNIVDVVAPYGEAGVRGGLQATQDLVVAVVEVDAVDVIARHHHIIDRDLLQIENVQQHAAVARRNQRTRLGDDGAQFLGGHMLFFGGPRVDPEQAQQAIGHTVHQPHHGIHGLHQGQQNDAGREGDAFRIERCYGLGRDFGEHQYHQGQADGGDGDAGVAPQAYGDDRGDSRGKDVDQVVADQDQADQAIRSFQQFAGTARAAMPLFPEVLQPVTVEGHHAGFRAGKETRQKNENNQNGGQETQRGFVQSGGEPLA